MKLESQVCSLEHAKKLKELGFEQVSLFYWCSYTQFVDGEMVTDWLLESKENMVRKGLDVGLVYSAFSVAELIDLVFYDKHEIRIYRNAGGYNLTDSFTGYDKHIATFNMADHWAEFLIWLVENKHLNPKEGE